MHRAVRAQFSPTPLTLLNVFHIHLLFLLLLLLLFEFSAHFVTPSQCHVALAICVNSFQTLWFWEQTKPRTLFALSRAFVRVAVIIYLPFVVLFLWFFFLFVFFVFFIHYCSVDSSHPSSHPPPATDGAAGANATDNANASLVNGTSQPPACRIWWISLLTVSNSLSPPWPAQMLCVCVTALWEILLHTLCRSLQERPQGCCSFIPTESSLAEAEFGILIYLPLKLQLKGAVKSGQLQNFWVDSREVFL